MQSDVHRRDLQRTTHAPDGRTVRVVEPGWARVRRHWKTALVASIALLTVASVATIAAITANQTAYQGISGDVYSYDDTTFDLIAGGHLLNALPASASGDTSGTAVEMALIPGSANTALSIGDWTYLMTVQELGIATVPSGTYEAELFVDGTSQGSLFFKQDTPDALSIEGATLTWSLGASLPTNGAYVVKITSV